MSTPEKKTPPDNRELVSAIARDPNLVYWFEVIRERSDIPPGQIYGITNAAWKVTALQHGVGDELQISVFDAVITRLQERDREREWERG